MVLPTLLRRWQVQERHSRRLCDVQPGRRHVVGRDQRRGSLFLPPPHPPAAHRRQRHQVLRPMRPEEARLCPRPPRDGCRLRRR
ncbi:hypothetical protein FFLO_02096 [Filobasidium floriforme]|uniref:Uncharacterized protein n=1 Tax=Filobasidium floriforme TaxID=5210 RepID=A0A8K0NUC9_9TREE|nr:hypothetical protein FFLO_02096 [Filobasidium floriforme]